MIFLHVVGSSSDEYFSAYSYFSSNSGGDMKLNQSWYKIGDSKTLVIIKSFCLTRVAKMINILFFIFILVTCSVSYRVDSNQSIQKEDLELENHLKLINKPPLKSINTKFGDIIDCIDINKQPTLDHPLLKNHKLQRKPTFEKPITKTGVKNSPAKSKFLLEKYSCPTGTVPIRRTTKEDLIRTKLLLNYHILTKENPGTHVAYVTVFSFAGPFYGVRGDSSLYNPKVEKDQISSAHLWVQNGPVDTNNKIVAGWHVAPQLYGDNATHVFAAWTSDNFKKTGCYNYHCQGFVQTDNQIYLGTRAEKTSVYGGDIYEVSISITQDLMTKNWWVNMENRSIGYFPGALFSNLAMADTVGWGGRTSTSAGTPSPPMGSGVFPDDNFVHAAYFRHVAFRNKLGQLYGPDLQQTRSFTDKPECFGVKYYGDQGRDVGYSLQFGGPGGNCGN
ncbi:uncharacterized protein LOC113874464 [Abrus precatorius]|uniref:Uncharacterized protein LOC113874464 n=1 Tax=Abrus precatorius TaxID=3816 RepID=A0A8B8MKQ8_ABRPR|nr:uncharacterized protein LOC113874464 [Abrus precatorius]